MLGPIWIQKHLVYKGRIFLISWLVKVVKKSSFYVLKESYKRSLKGTFCSFWLLNVFFFNKNTAKSQVLKLKEFSSFLSFLVFLFLFYRTCLRNYFPQTLSDSRYIYLIFCFHFPWLAYILIYYYYNIS